MKGCNSLATILAGIIIIITLVTIANIKANIYKMRNSNKYILTKVVNVFPLYIGR